MSGNLALKAEADTEVLAQSCISDNPTKVDQKTLDDYYAFFSGKEVDMLPYIYMEPSDAYSDLVQNCSDYYVFKDEVATIEHNKDKLSKHLKDVIDVIEIGPGFDYTISRKTLPILSCAKNLKNYYAVDHSENYLKDACFFIQNNRPDINVFSVEADLMNGAINLPKNLDKKCVIFLGSTLGNFNHVQQHYVVKQLAKIVNSGDLLILTADTNKNPESVIKAYTGEGFVKFARCALWHFSKIIPEFKKHVLSFDIKCEWNIKDSSLDRFFVANQDISFDYKGFGNIAIQKGQKLRGIKSRKSSLDEMTLLLEDYFSVVDTISYSEKMKIFVCQRI